jgi:hypothetical protein
MDMGVEQNNPSRGTVIDGDDVVFFNALAALPVVDDPVATTNTDATSDASLGPPANGDDMEPASDPTGLLADGTGAPLAPDASLGLPADRSNMPGNVDVSEICPDNVDSIIANHVGDGASGNCTPGLSTGWGTGPLASSGGSIGSDGGYAPLAADASLGLLAGRSTSQGDGDVTGIGPNDVTGDVVNPDDGALGDYTMAFRPGWMSAHRHPPAERSVRLTGGMPLR